MSSEWSVAHDEREAAESSWDSKQTEKHARPWDQLSAHAWLRLVLLELFRKLYSFCCSRREGN